MKKIVLWNSIYKEYNNDNLFDIEKCKIGQNLLLPNVELRNRLNELDIDLHTYDFLLKINRNPDLVICQDIPYDTYDVVKTNFLKKFKYILKHKNKLDAVKSVESGKHYGVLVLSEPHTVCPESYNPEFHKHFARVYTWADDLIDNKKYFKYFIPQPKPKNLIFKKFEDKKLLTIIASDKSSNSPNELYSERRRAIYEAINYGVEVDLYGNGWNKEQFKVYKGAIDDKLKVLSNYKFCICFENMRNVNGYITEKIFDCFFSGVVPIYYGAPNIGTYIPENTFINFNNFKTYGDLFEFLKSMDNDTYDEYILNAKKYLSSNEFYNTFSMDNYVRFFSEQIEELVNGVCK